MAAEQILKALQELEDEEYKDFKFYLRQPENLCEGCDTIPKGLLQSADKITAVSLITQSYPTEAPQIMINVLKKINRKDLLLKFQANDTSGNSAASSQGPKTGQGVTESSPEVVFVTKHRGALIKRVTMVAPILDLLVDEGVLKSEDYGDVRSKATVQEQMRKLFDLLDPRGPRAKSIFYKGLEENETFLLEDLKKP